MRQADTYLFQAVTMPTFILHAWFTRDVRLAGSQLFHVWTLQHKKVILPIKY